MKERLARKVRDDRKDRKLEDVLKAMGKGKPKEEWEWLDGLGAESEHSILEKGRGIWRTNEYELGERLNWRANLLWNLGMGRRLWELAGLLSAR